jgi:benzoyl-CoA 2,3-dioxygenase component B
MDLFGSELSSNAAAYFTAGLKGRWHERRRKDDHELQDQTREMTKVEDGRLVTETVPLLNALNLDLRDEYVADCENGIRRWNQALEGAGLPHRLRLPHEGFNRGVGVYADAYVSPDGEVLTQDEWDARSPEWLPSAQDLEDVRSLMRPVYEPGEFAGWISPPAQGINKMGVEFDYVRFWREDS